MKIKYIVNARIPTEKAHGYQICKMCEEFSSAGVELELVMPQREDGDKKDIFSYYNLKNNFKFKYLESFNFFKLEKYLGKLSFYFSSLSFFFKLFFKKIDKDAIIYSRNPEICWLFNLKGNKSVFDAHNWPSSKVYVFKYFIKKVLGVVCNSRGTENVFKKNGFRKTLLAPNGVDIDKFNIADSVEDIRGELALPRDKKIILYVGHLYRWKGIDVVLLAAELLSKREDIVFIIVGGTEEDIKRYRQRVATKKLQNVTIVGHKKQQIIPRYLKSADVLLLPNIPISEESIKYTSPIKMFEYMASEKPIVASALTSIKEVLNNSNSLLFEAGNEKDLVEKIETLLADHELGKKISARAYLDAQKYSWANRAKSIIEFIKNNR